MTSRHLLLLSSTITGLINILIITTLLHRLALPGVRGFHLVGRHHNRLQSGKRSLLLWSASSSTMSSIPSPPSYDGNKLRFVDIGANLLDDRFTKGIYHDKQRHEPDFDLVIHRATQVGVKHVVITAGTVEESASAVQEVRRLRQKQAEASAGGGGGDIRFFCTVGVHPTRTQQEFVDNNNNNNNDEESLQRLLEIAQDGMSDGVVCSIGEIGLDYDRLQFSPKDVQRKYFIRQLEVLAANTGLPLFLHNRSVGSDLYDILKEYKDCWKRGGVVHSFDDTHQLAMKFIDDLGLYIGLNGCSLRTEENLQVAKELPLDRILLETDCPFCEVKRTHAGFHHVKTTFPTKQEKKFEMGVMVKGRCEPCQIIQVAEVVAGAKGLSLQEVADCCFDNSLKLYGWEE